MNYRFKMFFLISSMVLLTGNVSYAVQDTNFGLGKAILKLFFYTLILIFVLVVTVYGTKFIAKKSKRFANGKYIQILDSLNIGTNTRVMIMEINSIVYILAITNNAIEVIDKFQVEDFKLDREIDFEEQLDKYKNRYTHDIEFISKFNTKIKKALNRSNNKFIDKEDEDNEKKC